MRKTMFSNTYKSSLTNDYPDKLYHEVKKLKEIKNKQQEHKQEYINKLKQIEALNTKALGTEAIYWVMKAKLDLMTAATEKLFNDDISIVERVEEIQKTLLESKFLSSENYGEIAYGLYQQLYSLNNHAEAAFWFLQAIESKNAAALQEVPTPPFSDGLRVFSSTKVATSENIKLHFKAALTFLICHYPKAYFIWQKYIVEQDSDVTFTAPSILDTTPEKIVLDFLQGKKDIVKFLKFLEKFTSKGILDRNYWIDTLDIVLDFCNRNLNSKTHTQECQLSDEVKDWILYQKGSALLHLQQRDAAKKVFKLISKFNTLLFAETNIELGSYYMATKNYEKALKYFQIAVENGIEGSTLEAANKSIAALKEQLRISTDINDKAALPETSNITK